MKFERGYDERDETEITELVTSRGRYGGEGAEYNCTTVRICSVQFAVVVKQGNGDGRISSTNIIDQ